MRRTANGWVFVLLLLLATRAHAQQPIVDEANCFRLEPPGGGWELLDRVEVQRLAPEAAAGAKNAEGLTVLVVAERAFVSSLDEYLALIRDGWDFGDFEVLRREEAVTAGQPSLRILCEVTQSGESMRVQTIALARGHSVWQVTGIGPIGSVPLDGSIFEPVVQAFSLLEGEVRGHAAEHLVVEADGPGWRVRGGRFECVHGLAVDPKPPWRLAVRDEARELTEDSHVGLIDDAQGLYVSLQCFEVPASSADEWRDRCRSLASGDLVDAQPGPRLKIAGSMRDTLKGGLQDFGATAITTTWTRGGHGHLLLAWATLPVVPALLHALPSAAASVSHLSTGDTAALLTDRAGRRHDAGTIGPQWSHWGNTYRDFAHGFEWRLPSGLWELTTGDAAAIEKAGDCVDFRCIGLGLSGWVSYSPADGDALADVHGSMLMSSGIAVNIRDAVAIEVGGRPALQSIVGDPGSDAETWTTLITVDAGTWFVDIALDTSPGAPADADEEWRQALAGMQFPGRELRPVEVSDGTWYDVRCGFLLRMPDPSWRVRPLGMSGQPDPQADGALLRRGDAELAVTVVPRPAEGTDERWFLELMRDELGHAGERIPDETIEPEAATIAGLPALRLAWSFGKDGVEIHALQRDRILYGLIASGSEKERATMLATFQLLP